MGLFGGSTTTKNETVLNPQQKKLVNLGTPFAEQYAHTPTTWPTTPGHAPLTPGQKAHLAGLTARAADGPLGAQGQADLARLRRAQALANTRKQIPGVTPFTAPEREGQAMALAAAKGGQTDLANESADTSKFLLHDVLFPGSNPALQQTIDAATRPIQQDLMEQTLPGLRSGAAVSGNYGSSRQGIAEGLASGRASQAIGDTGAKVANANYQAGLDAMTKALGLVPQTQQAQVTPAVTTSGVGEVQHEQNQNVRDDLLMRKLFNQNASIDKARNLIGLASGSPGGGTSSSASGSTGLLQGALGGASLGSAIFPGVGTAAGAGIGALLAALS